MHHVVILVKLVNSQFTSKQHWNAIQVCSTQWFAFRLLRDTRSSAIAESPARRCGSAHAKYSVSHHMIIKQFLLLRLASYGNHTIPSTRPVAAIQISTVCVINSGWVDSGQSKSLWHSLATRPWTGLKLTAPETISCSRDMVGAHQNLNGPRT